VVVVAARRPASPGLAVWSFLQEAALRWPRSVPMIERYCARLQMILQSSARISHFCYRCRSIVSVG
jgi:hypothetical protein